MRKDRPSFGEPIVTRRAVLRGGAALTAAPLLSLVGCSSDGEATDEPAGVGGSASGGSKGTGGASSGPKWATGGTASMSGDYPDPFADVDFAGACLLSCASTLGPCYAETIERRDISEGHAGLPMRLALLVVDETCEPIAGAVVDIWHTAPEGMYSGADSIQMCNLGNEDALASRWFRGVQTTDEKGRVDFDTCFPGWYSGRTIHIHFTVRVGDTDIATSQLFFKDDLSDSIIETEPLYGDRGTRDTTNTNDGVVRDSPLLDRVLLETERMSDGALLAYKALVVRSSTADALCTL